MSAINLVKDQKIDLTKSNPGLKSIVVGAGWDVASGATGDFDLDLFGFIYKGGVFGKQMEDLAFYNNKTPVTGIVVSEDNRTGEGAGDDETITIDFGSLPGDVDAIVIGIDIHEAKERGQNFGMVKSSYISISDGTNVLVRYDLNEDFGVNTLVVLGKLYKRDGEWKFEALGNGFEADIAEAASIY